MRSLTFNLFVERDDDHFEEEEGLVDVGGFSQGLARRARFVRALAACQVHHVQLRAPHLCTQGTPNHKAQPNHAHTTRSNERYGT